MDLDFSEFHPLDHPLWACRGYHGGVREHVSLYWQFILRDKVRVRLAHLFLTHSWQGYVRFDSVTRVPRYEVACRGCDARPSDLVAARIIGNMMHDENLDELTHAFPWVSFTDDDMS